MTVATIVAVQEDILIRIEFIWGAAVAAVEIVVLFCCGIFDF